MSELPDDSQGVSERRIEVPGPELEPDAVEVPAMSQRVASLRDRLVAAGLVGPSKDQFRLVHALCHNCQTVQIQAVPATSGPATCIECEHPIEGHELPGALGAAHVDGDE